MNLLSRMDYISQAAGAAAKKPNALKVEKKPIDKNKGTKIKSPKNMTDIKVSTKKKLSKKLNSPPALEPAQVKPSKPKNSPKEKVSPQRKTKDFWDTLTLKEQKEYIEKHPRTKFKITKKPSAKSTKKMPKTPKDKKADIKSDKTTVENKPIIKLPESANDNIKNVKISSKIEKAPGSSMNNKQKEKLLTQAHIFAKALPVGAESLSKHAKEWAKHIYNATPSRASMRMAAKSVLKVLGPKGRKEFKDMKEELNSGKADETTIKKASVFGSLVKVVAVLGIGAVGVMAYHAGVHNTIAIVGHLVDTYNHKFSNLFNGGGFRDSRGSNSAFMASLGSASHHHGRHHS